MKTTLTIALRANLERIAGDADHAIAELLDVREVPEDVAVLAADVARRMAVLLAMLRQAAEPIEPAKSKRPRHHKQRWPGAATELAPDAGDGV